MLNPEINKAGTKRWYKNGMIHRDGGPAIEHINNDKYWYKNGKRHRDDGPAIEYASGTKYWYKNGIEITKEEIRAILSNPDSSPEDLAPFKSAIEDDLKCQIQIS